ncbi:Dipeptidyl peptidase 4 [Escovopsis weberi]|uniref:Probable dipeptidyl-aminopeptidase B n=1 Tax=Escovopsis weberi TaxID=150374 RepID=A0A0M8N0A6_ESCWE|nr:Dipeptidyl peptidase 4 [Escovopsis weberi]
MVPSVGTCAALLALASSLAQAALDRPRQPHQPTGQGDRLLRYNETTPRPAFRPTLIGVQWSKAGNDGEYITRSKDGDLILEDIVSGKSHVFIPSDELPGDLHDYWIGSDRNTILLATNATKQYRHSYFADYFILDAASGDSVPLVEDQAGDIQYAVLSPDTRSTAFVRRNDVFIRDSRGKIHQITSNGSPDMFNGVPDWVYEEEIFADRFTLWFSPDSKYVAFLSFNETGVKTFSIPYYMDKQKIAPTYPVELELRYPKVGTPNPTVQFSILDVETLEHSVIPVDAFGSDTIIGEVAWVTDAHSAVIYRAFNRPQDLEKHVLVNPETKTGKVVRERDGTDGWLDNTVAITYVGRVNDGDEQTYYVDLSDESGWMHIYLYPVQGGEPVQLTSGEWEVDSILHVDGVKDLIYYSATTRHSAERHIYSVSFATKEIRALVDDDVPAVWSASFSSEGGFYILSYMGPDVPYQELHSTNSTGRSLRTITTNEDYYSRIDEYNLPNITYFELEHPDGFTLNVMQQLPPNFDETRKYPSLFTPYGGPNSQSVLKTFHSHNWNAYISSEPELQFVTYTVDNRGTGFKGRAFRSAVSRRLGALEPQDQIWAAETLLARNRFLDAGKVGMWGWSFGGFLTAKTVERDSGVFTLGLSTAPVSDWRFYDTMYTERYMKTLEANADGYNSTAVRRTDGFKNIEGAFALMHGTGDDNVHFQNAAALVDLLMGDGVSPRKFKMMAFTDSDHGISYHGGSEFIYKFLTERLWEEVRRKPGKTLKHQWYKKGLGRP